MNGSMGLKGEPEATVQFDYVRVVRCDGTSWLTRTIRTYNCHNVLARGGNQVGASRKDGPFTGEG